jgi:hypothetical protein
LRRIIERNEPRYAAAAYILAAMLERKRLLKVKEQFHRDGLRIFVYEHPKTAEIFTITDPDLHLNQPEQVQQIQREVADLLEHGFPEDRLATVTTDVPTGPDAEAAASAEPAVEVEHAPETVTG